MPGHALPATLPSPARRVCGEADDLRCTCPRLIGLPSMPKQQCPRSTAPASGTLLAVDVHRRDAGPPDDVVPDLESLPTAGLAGAAQHTVAVAGRSRADWRERHGERDQCFNLA